MSSLPPDGQGQIPGSDIEADNRDNITKSSLWRVITRFDTAQLEPAMAFRNTIGTVLPLVVGASIGHLLGGLLVSTGALNVAFSDGRGPYQPRLLRMLAASLFGALSVFIGVVLSGSQTGAIVVATGWAFCGGLLVALGTVASDMGAMSCVLLIVFLGQQMNPASARSAALLVLSGGVLQAILAVILWPFRRFAPERRALGKLYRELAVAFSSPALPHEPPPVSKGSQEAQDLLRGLNRNYSGQAERCRSLLNQAERIRLSLLALNRLRSRLEERDASGPPAHILTEVLQKSATVLELVSHALLDEPSEEPVQELHTAIADCTQKLQRYKAECPSSLCEPVEEGILQIDALAGQLRAASDLAAGLSSRQTLSRTKEKREWETEGVHFNSVWKAAFMLLKAKLAILQANCNLRSTAFRHAIRLSAGVAVGETVSRILQLHRGYWLPMTVVIILKPDFTATFSRGVLRLGGTFLGLLLSTALFHVLPPTIGTHLLLLAIFAYLLRWVGPTNYGILVVSITGLIVLLLAFGGTPPSQAITARGLNTAAGGVLALVSYWLWPTWEHGLIGESLARMLESYREYFRAVSDAYQKQYQASATIDKARIASRLARSNAEASLDRFSGEPGTKPEEVAAVSAMLASSHRFIHAVMALEAGLARSSPVAARPLFRRFSNDVDLTLYLLATALRSPDRLVFDAPDLREDQKQLASVGDESIDRYALVNVESDRIANSLNTFREQVIRWARLWNPRRNSSPVTPSRIAKVGS